MSIASLPPILQVGKKAAFYDKATDVYMDVIIKKLFNRATMAHVSPVGEPKKVIELPVSFLEKSIDSDVNERFRYFTKLSKLVIDGSIKSLFVTGEGGIGKTYTVDELLEGEEMEEDKDYVKVSGHCTPLALFNLIEDNFQKVLVFDDCDSVLEDHLSGNILKAVLDTYARRTVKWLSSKGSRSVEFEGSVIFLSNRSIEQTESAILSRSVVIDLYMTPEEKIERMSYIIEGLKCTPKLNLEGRMEVLNMIDKYKNTINNLNLRTLLKALIVYDSTRDMEITRYQILNT